MVKTIITRIKNKIDYLENWQNSSNILLDGEIAVVRVVTGESYLNPVTGKTEPVVELLMKVGDNEHTFNELPWLSAKASDVYNWAKASDVVLEGEKIKFVGTGKEISLTPLGYLTEDDVKSKITDAIVEDISGLSTKVAGIEGALGLEAGSENSISDRLASVEGVIETLTGDASTEGSVAKALTDAKAYVDAEDKFEIDMVTVNAHGGVAAGEDLNGLTTHEILKKILYPYVQPTVGNATANPNGGTYEKGVTKTITSVSISITKKSEIITSVALYNGSTLIEEKTGDAVKNGGTITFSNLSVVVPTSGNQLTVKVTDAKGTSQEKKTTAMTFVYPYYMGTCAAGTAIDEALIESLTKKIESKGNKSNSFTVSDGHMVFAYPKAHGVLKSVLDPNNFETIGNYTRSEVSVTGLDGTAQTYYVYVSGATTVSGFVVNFKY